MEAASPALAARGREQLAIGLLFAMGLLLGLVVAPAIAEYANADPSALCQAAGAMFWALLASIVFGIVAIFVSIPNGTIIYAVAGLAIFGAFTIFDTNGLRRARDDGAVVIAAGIFLDIFNVFLLLLNLSRGRDDQSAVR